METTNSKAPIWKWAAATALVAISVVVGYGGGIFAAAMRVYSDSPMVKVKPTGSDFNQLSEGMGRLSFDEMMFAKCDDDRAMKRALQNEASLMPVLARSSAAASLHPQLMIARARVAIREAEEAKAHGDLAAQSKSENEVADDLTQAGWKDASANHLREVLRKSGEMCNTPESSR